MTFLNSLTEITYNLTPRSHVYVEWFPKCEYTNMAAIFQNGAQDSDMKKLMTFFNSLTQITYILISRSSFHVELSPNYKQ